MISRGESKVKQRCREEIIETKAFQVSWVSSTCMTRMHRSASYISQLQGNGPKTSRAQDEEVSCNASWQYAIKVVCMLRTAVYLALSQSDSTRHEVLSEQMMI